jgi:hypothetical protein
MRKSNQEILATFEAAYDKYEDVATATCGGYDECDCENCKKLCMITQTIASLIRVQVSLDKLERFLKTATKWENRNKTAACDSIRQTLSLLDENVDVAMNEFEQNNEKMAMFL